MAGETSEMIMVTLKRLTVLIVVTAVTGATLAGCSSTASRLARTPRVPNVVGMQLSTADSVLTRSHLHCSSWPGGSGRPFGTVIAQSPAPGTIAVRGLTVTVYYSVENTGISIPVGAGCV